MTLNEAEEDSSLVKQVKAAVLLILKEWYQDDDIQKLMEIGMLLDPQFKKIPYLTEVGQTAIWLQARDELVAIIRLTKIKSQEGFQSSHDHPHTGDSHPLHICSLKIGNLQSYLVIILKQLAVVRLKQKRR